MSIEQLEPADCREVSSETEARPMSKARDARIGQWYLRRDTGETFLVTGFDDRSRTVEMQTSDGDLDEVEEAAWQDWPIALAEPPQDWSGPMDDVDAEDLDDSSTSGTGAGGSDWPSSQEPHSDAWEPWGDIAAEEEIASHTERAVPDDFTPEGTDDVTPRLSIDRKRGGS
jgi:hypothetical protein